MVRSHRVTRSTLAILCAVTGLVLATPSSAATVAKPTVTLSLSSWMPEQGTLVSATVCWTHARVGDAVQMDEARGTDHIWTAVLGVWARKSDGCKTWAYRVPVMFKYPMRAQVLERSSRVSSAVRDMTVYGHISGDTFWSNVIRPLVNCSGIVSDGTNAYPYFTAWGIGCWGTSVVDFQVPTSCRLLELEMVSTDKASGDPTSDGVSTVSITQGTLDPQSVTFDDDTVESAHFVLDGSQAEMTFANSVGSGIYLLASSYADCHTELGY